MAGDSNRSERFSGFRALGRALVHRNYRLFFLGQGISLVGTWMTQTATLWLVYRLGGDEVAFRLGAIGFAAQAPTFFLAPLAGPLVDRWSRRRVLVSTQALSLLQSALLAIVAFNAEPGARTFWQLAALSLLQGFINAFDMPGRQAFLVEMVTRKEDLGNAIALNSSLVNAARLVGPSLAGVVIAQAAPHGEAWCFVIDAVSYLAVVASLLAMQVAPPATHLRRLPVGRAMVEGFRYAFGFAPIRALLLLLALVSFMGMPQRVLMPVFAGSILHGNAYTLGFLTGASGIGALAGAVFLASRKSVLGLGRVIVVATTLFGLGSIGFSYSHWLAISLPLMMLTGFGMMVQMAASNTILQTIVDEDKRGRVMSFYSMAFLGAAPFGSLFAGYAAEMIGAPGTVQIGGFACVAGAALFALGLPRLRELVRPVYARIGVLPEVAKGIQAAAELTRPPEE